MLKHQRPGSCYKGDCRNMPIVYRNGMGYDTCCGCNKEMEAGLLYYDLPDNPKDEPHSPKCHWCLIREAQEIYGVENVRLGNEN